MNARDEIFDPEDKEVGTNTAKEKEFTPAIINVEFGEEFEISHNDNCSIENRTTSPKG